VRLPALSRTKHALTAHRYASIGAVLMSQRVRDGLYSGLSMHGHTYQANPLACAAALAVQREIADKDLLANCRAQGALLERLLRERLLGPNARARPYVFDIRGGGGFWSAGRCGVLGRRG
jgi:E3 ubiquitin-protein ligase TRIP12